MSRTLLIQIHWTGIVTGGPSIQAALTTIVAIPFVVSAGTRKLIWYPSVVPGYPVALSTSAAFPFTVTATGELTTARGVDGNVWPGLSAGRVGPKPVANSVRISPAAAGLEAVTSEKSAEWVTAGPPGVTATPGTDCGTT